MDRQTDRHKDGTAWEGGTWKGTECAHLTLRSSVKGPYVSRLRHLDSGESEACGTVQPQEGVVPQGHPLMSSDWVDGILIKEPKSRTGGHGGLRRYWGQPGRTARWACFICLFVFEAYKKVTKEIASAQEPGGLIQRAWVEAGSLGGEGLGPEEGCTIWKSRAQWQTNRELGSGGALWKDSERECSTSKLCAQRARD